MDTMRKKKREKNIVFTTTSKMKNLRVNLNKEVKASYSEKWKALKE